MNSPATRNRFTYFWTRYTKWNLRFDLATSAGAVLFAWVGAFAPILFSWLIFNIAHTHFDLNKFATTGDYFIIADGLVLPAMFLLSRQGTSLRPFPRTIMNLIGIGVVTVASTAFGVVKLLEIISHDPGTPDANFLVSASLVLVLISLGFSFYLQLIDDARDINAKQKQITQEPEKELTSLERSFDSVKSAPSSVLREDFGKYARDLSLNEPPSVPGLNSPSNAGLNSTKEPGGDAHV